MEQTVFLPRHGHKKLNFMIQNRRMIRSQDECEHDLHEEIPLLFVAFSNAVKLYEQELAQTPPPYPRGFEAALMNAKIIQCIRKFFPDHSIYGKYKRFILRINGYNILFKKLNSKGLPMNVRTKFADSIDSQLTLDLFQDEADAQNSILFFGYKKNSFGEIEDVKLVCIDNGTVKWEITEESIQRTIPISAISTSVNNEPLVSVRPELNKKVSNN